MYPIQELEAYKKAIYSDSRSFYSSIELLEITVEDIIEEEQVVGKIFHEEIVDTFDDSFIQTIEFTEDFNAGDNITLGSACSSCVKINFFNKDKLFEEKSFVGKPMRIKIGLDVDGVVQWTPLGIFVVTESKKNNDFLLKLTAFDRMELLERQYNANAIKGTLKGLAQAICNELNVPMSSKNFPNQDYYVEYNFEIETTYRNFISLIAEAAGSMVRFNRAGELEFVWFEEADISLNKNNSFSIKEAEFIVPPIDAISVRTEEDDLGLTVGDGENEYEIINNPLFYLDPREGEEEEEPEEGTETEAEVAEVELTDNEEEKPEEKRLEAAMYNILNNVGQLTYAPVELSVQGNPIVQAGDIIKVEMVEGEEKICPVMHVKLMYNGGLIGEIEADGTSLENRKPLKVREEIIVLKKKSNILRRDLESNTLRIEQAENDMGNLTERYNDITQTVEDLEISIGKVGGKNLLKNSSGLNGIKEWTITGNVSTEQGKEISEKTTAKSAFIMEDGMMSQSIYPVTKTYAYYFKYYKDVSPETPVSTVQIGNKEIELNQNNRVWNEEQGTFTLEVNEMGKEFPVYIIGNGNLKIADLIVAEGDAVSVWQQAEGELMNAGMIIDEHGITMSNNNSQFKGVYNHEQVEYTSGGTPIARFHAEGADMGKTKIKSQLSLEQQNDSKGALRIIPKDNGVYFVIND